MTSEQRPKPVLPDMNDPFGPPVPPRLVVCLDCEEEYMSSQMKWDSRQRLWACRNHPSCAGAGYGFDIHPSIQPEEWEAIR